MIRFRRNRQVTGLIAVIISIAAAIGTAKADHFTPTGPAIKVATGTSGSGYTNTEGPVYDGNGGVLFGELNSTHTNDLIWRYNIAAKQAAVVVSNSGGTEGDYYDAGGNLITSDRDTRQISLRPSSNLSTVQKVLASTYNNIRFNGPNDLVIDSGGGIFFTDPNFENFSNRQPQDAVYYITPLGAVNQVLQSGNTRPNGLIISPDHNTFYVDLWASNVIMEYSLNAPGVLTNGRTYVSAVSPDGLTADPWGDIIAARSGGISCWSPSGTKLFDVSIPEASYDATNVELVGNTLYVTAGISLYSVPLTEVPEPSSVGVLAAALALLSRRRASCQRTASSGTSQAAMSPQIVDGPP